MVLLVTAHEAFHVGHRQRPSGKRQSHVGWWRQRIARASARTFRHPATRRSRAGSRRCTRRLRAESARHSARRRRRRSADNRARRRAPATETRIAPARSLRWPRCSTVHGWPRQRRRRRRRSAKPAAGTGRATSAAIRPASDGRRHGRRRARARQAATGRALWVRSAGSASSRSRTRPAGDIDRRHAEASGAAARQWTSTSCTMPGPSVR